MRDAVSLRSRWIFDLRCVVAASLLLVLHASIAARACCAYQHSVVVAGDTLPQWLVYSVSIFWSVTVSRVRTKLRLGGTVGAIWFSV